MKTENKNSKFQAPSNITKLDPTQQEPTTDNGQLRTHNSQPKTENKKLTTYNI